MDGKDIIDTIYQARYATSNSKMIDDIRQISAYARDNKILSCFPTESCKDLMPCLIIYPEKMNNEDEEVMTLGHKIFYPIQPLLKVLKSFTKSQ